MPYLSSLHIDTERTHPYPYDVPAVRYAKHIDLSNPVTFIIGENGTGKSTLLESIACRLQLPHIDGYDYFKNSFNAAKKLLAHMQLEWSIERSVGFFFRAEDFGDYLNSVHRNDIELHNSLEDLQGKVPDYVLQQMKDSANYQLHRVRKDYGQELELFSHGEAYMHIMNQMVSSRGIYILDEPEAALSPSKQLSFIYFLRNHLQNNLSQFIIDSNTFTNAYGLSGRNYL